MLNFVREKSTKEKQLKIGGDTLYVTFLDAQTN
ncbi:hypothetical protein ACVWYG_000501 [Pedobacter sp. UYEF25]